MNIGAFLAIQLVELLAFVFLIGRYVRAKMELEGQEREVLAERAARDAEAKEQAKWKAAAGQEVKVLMDEITRLHGIVREDDSPDSLRARLKAMRAGN